jgi:prepilin-type N-terminal cleavage/methylation domain-containing protein
MRAFPAFRTRKATPANPAGFTLVELVVTIGIVGVLTGIAIPIYSNVRSASEEGVAVDHVESLNTAVAKFSQECWKIPTTASPDVTDDEYLVLRSLQYRFPGTDSKPGSPFFNPNYNPGTSSNTSDLRIRWNGKNFELLKHGQPGKGLKYDNGNDVKNNPYSFPTGYKPEGAG